MHLIPQPKYEEEKKEHGLLIRQPSAAINKIDSVLLKNKDYPLMKQWLNVNQLKFVLLYRGSEHGFKRD